MRGGGRGVLQEEGYMPGPCYDGNCRTRCGRECCSRTTVDRFKVIRTAREWRAVSNTHHMQLAVTCTTLACMLSAVSQGVQVESLFLGSWLHPC